MPCVVCLETAGPPVTPIPGTSTRWPGRSTPATTSAASAARRGRSSGPSLCSGSSSYVRRRDEPAEQLFDQPRDCERGAVLQIGPDDLDADRQPRRGESDGHDGGG